MIELTELEKQLLEKYGSFYQKLLSGEVPADNPEKIHFLRVFKRGFSPINAQIHPFTSINVPISHCTLLLDILICTAFLVV